MGKHGKALVKAKYATVKIPGHPLAHADGRIRIHRAVLYDKIGPGPHSCHWCDRAIDWTGKPPIVVDHINGDTWDNSPANLVPACTGCNTGRVRAAVCKNGHRRTPENTYIRPDKGTRMCLECARASKRPRIDGPPSARPRRVALSIPAGGLTVRALREFVEATRPLSGEQHVYMAHELTVDPEGG